MSDVEYVRMEYEANQLRWQSQHNYATHSDRLTAEIGIFVLKVVILINGAALVSIIAAYPQIIGIPKFASAIPIAGAWYLKGLLISVLAGGLAYFCQGAITLGEWNSMQVVFDKLNPEFPWADPLSNILRWVVIFLLIGSYIMFALGSFTLLKAFELSA